MTDRTTPDGEEWVEPRTEFLIGENSESRMLLHAQSLYMNFCPLSRIIKNTGISPSQLKHRVYVEGGWQDQRTAMQKELNEAIKQSALSQLKKINHIGLDLIEMSLAKVRDAHLEAKTAPTLGEAVAISEIWKNIHKAKIAEEMRDNDNEGLTVSPEEILKQLTSDPYFGQAFIAAKEPDEPDEDTPVKIADALMERHVKNRDPENF